MASSARIRAFNSRMIDERSTASRRAENHALEICRALLPPGYVRQSWMMNTLTFWRRYWTRNVRWEEKWTSLYGRDIDCLQVEIFIHQTKCIFSKNTKNKRWMISLGKKNIEKFNALQSFVSKIPFTSRFLNFSNTFSFRWSAIGKPVSIFYTSRSNLYPQFRRLRQPRKLSIGKSFWHILQRSVYLEGSILRYRTLIPGELHHVKVLVHNHDDRWTLSTMLV